MQILEQDIKRHDLIDLLPDDLEVFCWFTPPRTSHVKMLHE